MSSAAGTPERPDAVQSFHWSETAERLRELAEETALVPEPRGRFFVAAQPEPGARLEFHPPLVLAGTSPALGVQEYLEALPAELGLQLVLLIQAGAVALGLWEDDTLVRHKAIKRYVVRGSGRAQPLHLKSRGKSRYGSRLRLRNAHRLLLDVNERLIAWPEEHGAPDRIFVSCPVRTWPELWQVRPPPPFDPRDPAVTRIPIHVHVPDFAELRRVRGQLARGRILT